MTRIHWLALLLLGANGCLGGVDECDRGAARCNAGNPETCEEDCSDFGCHNRWQIQTFCTAAQSCIAPSDTSPLCAESPAKDLQCADLESATYCKGDELVQCEHGYRATTRPCGSVDEFSSTSLPGGSASTMCIDPGDGTATCIPQGASVDPQCDGITGPRCAGTTLVECVDHYAVFKTACASCAVQTTQACASCPPTTRGSCHGYLGDDCAVGEDCASGLLCHDEGNGRKVCSLACTVETPNASDAGRAPLGANAECYAAFDPDGTSVSAYSELSPAGHLSCIAGYCKWAP